MTEAHLLLRRFMLALAVWREARGESARGQELVAAVILNRVADPRWPATVVGVITQPWQFSAFNPKDANALKFPAEEDSAWAACVAAADAALSQHPAVTTANHYHVVGLAPPWRDDTKIVAREGQHVFYAL